MRRLPLGRKGIIVRPWRRSIPVRGRLTSAIIASVKRKLLRDGIVIVRNLLPSTTVVRGRNAILRLGRFSLEARKPWPSLLSSLHIQQDHCVRKVLEGPRVATLMRGLLGSPIMTTKYKWLRAMPPKLFTGVHTDAAYFGTDRHILTSWIPFTKVPVRRGLVWVPKSHLTDVFTNRMEQWDIGQDGTKSGWLMKDASLLKLPNGMRWHGTSMNPGDVAIFGVKLLHMTMPNDSPCFRISCDTRWHCGYPSTKGTGPWREVASVPRSPSI
eukprot:GEMP01009166.1.p1 GENE.GEMP01009166.1~~GEMP01009166.1.p1  ORF type:complete len:269 (+),score=21.06 GEMP01009166.1:57-863(+)